MSCTGSARARIAAALAVTVHPAVAAACPVCFSAANETVREAYYLTAACLTLLPLVIVGGFGIWLHRRLRTASGPHDERSQSFQA